MSNSPYHYPHRKSRHTKKWIEKQYSNNDADIVEHRSECVEKKTSIDLRHTPYNIRESEKKWREKHETREENEYRVLLTTKPRGNKRCECWQDNPQNKRYDHHHTHKYRSHLREQSLTLFLLMHETSKNGNKNSH